MGKLVERRPLKWYEEFYLPAIVSGLGRTFRQMFQPDITLQYPEERPQIADDYRGAPGLVKDDAGREKCVSCQLCEFICPPKAIVIVPAEIQDAQPDPVAGPSNIEKAPKEFWIDMLRCIYCGLCQEVCPEEAIFLQNQYSMTGYTRAEMVNDKARLYELGGTLPDQHFKWDKKKDAAEHGNAH